MNLPTYIRGFGDPIAAFPYQHNGAMLEGGFIRGRRDALEASVARTVGAIEGMEFEVVSPWVLLTSLFVERATSTHHDYARRGTVSEADVGFWILTRGGRRGGSKRLRWLPTYLFVDSGAAMAAGREVFGYPKMLGYPTRTGGGLGVAVRTLYFEHFADDARPVDDTLFAVEPTSASRKRSAESVDIATLEQRLASHLAGEEKGLKAAEIGLPYLRMPMLFLKQFRDVAHDDAACYQSVTEVDVVATKVRGASLVWDDYDVIVRSSASHPLEADLGIAQQSRLHLPFRVDHDFVVGAGQAL